MNIPKISVCIPVFNPGSYLRDAIDSVLKQSFDDFELLIIDDASTQPVQDTVAAYCDSRIRFERNLQNLGLVRNWNRCLELTRGAYVTIFHQDDLMLDENLSDKIRMLESSPRLGFVYSDIIRIDSAGKKIGGHYIPQPQVDLIMAGCEIFELVARTGNPIACPAVVARSECYKQLGAFNTNLPFATDLEMWLRIAAHYDVGFVARPLVAHRVHSAQETQRFSGSGYDYLDVLHALEIAYSYDLPLECLVTASTAYHTLAEQSRQMARWSLGKKRFQSVLVYSKVCIICLWLFLKTQKPPYMRTHK